MDTVNPKEPAPQTICVECEYPLAPGAPGITASFFLPGRPSHEHTFCKQHGYQWGMGPASWRDQFGKWLSPVEVIELGMMLDCDIRCWYCERSARHEEARRRTNDRSSNRQAPAGPSWPYSALPSQQVLNEAARIMADPALNTMLGETASALQEAKRQGALDAVETTSRLFSNQVRSSPAVGENLSPRSIPAPEQRAGDSSSAKLKKRGRNPSISRDELCAALDEYVKENGTRDGAVKAIAIKYTVHRSTVSRLMHSYDIGRTPT
jgi:hypothetical protein